MTRGPAFVAGVAESGLDKRADRSRDGKPQADAIAPVDGTEAVPVRADDAAPADGPENVPVRVELGAADISATDEIALAGGGSSIGWVDVILGRALPPEGKEVC